MRLSSAVVVKAGSNQWATEKYRMFPEICFPLCALPGSIAEFSNDSEDPLAFEIHEAVSELLHMRLHVAGELREHDLHTSAG